MKAIRLLSLRRLKLQPLRAVIASVVVGAGIALVVSVVVLSSSLDVSVREAGRALSGPTELRIIGATSRGGIDQSIVAKVEATEGVQAAIPLVQAITLATKADGDEVAVLALGYDCRIQALVGEFGCTEPTPGAPILLAVGSNLATEAGSGATLRTDLGRTPLDGAVPLPGLNGLNDGRVIAVPLAEAQRIFVRPNAIDVIYVSPAPGTDVGDLQDRLEGVVGPTYGVLRAADPPPAVGVVLATFLPLFSVIAILALAIGGVLVRNAINLSLEERRRQTAIVGALGGPARVLIGGTMIEAALLGFVGGILGAFAGIGIAHPIASSLSEFTTKLIGIPLKVHVEPIAFIVAIATGLAVSLAVSIGPARRAVRADVAAELSNRGERGEAEQATSISRIVAMCGLGVIGLDLCFLARHDGALEPWQASLAPLAFVITCIAMTFLTSSLAPRLLALAERFSAKRKAPTRLAIANLLREPKRTGVMAVALGFAVGVGFITASFNASVRSAVDENLTKHLTGVTVSSIDANNSVNVDAKISPDDLEKLRALPGVASVERGGGVLVGHTPGSLLVVMAFTDPWLDADSITGVIDRGRFDQGEVLIGPGLARSTGLRPGDDLPLDTPTGVAKVRIQAVIQNGDAGGRNVTMAYPLLEKLYGPQPSSEVVVKPTPGTTDEALAATIKAAKLDPAFKVHTVDEVKARIHKDLASQLAPFDAIQRGLLVMAFIAVLSTLLLVGVQRQRELGMLAAVGMTPREIGRMVVLEGGLVALAGVVLGLLTAAVMYGGLLLIAPVLLGYKDPFVIDPAAAIVYGVLAVVVALLAALWPARRAARIEVLEALRYE